MKILHLYVKIAYRFCCFLNNLCKMLKTADDSRQSDAPEEDEEHPCHTIYTELRGLVRRRLGQIWTGSTWPPPIHDKQNNSS